MTHLPKPTLPGRVPQEDKLLHLLAFATLGALLWKFGETLTERVSSMYVWKCAVVLIAYAAMDEWTQSPFGRAPSWLDFSANVTGAAIALAALEWHRRRGERSKASAT